MTTMASGRCTSEPGPLAKSMGMQVHAEGIEQVEQAIRGVRGVKDVHDLHIWAMSTTDVALSAHLVMPDGCPGDDFLQATAEGLFATFHIAHPTLQVESTPLVKRCVQQGHVHR